VPTIHRRDHQQGKSYRKPLSTVEETRNKMLDAEFDALYEAQFDEHRTVGIAGPAAMLSSCTPRPAR
jgi:hypothetical protein